jgi:hypothetical protein
MIVEMRSDPVPKRLMSCQSDVVRTVIVIQDIEADLVTEVAYAEAVTMRSSSAKHAELATVPGDLVDIPEQAVALNEPRIGSTGRSRVCWRHAATIDGPWADCKATAARLGSCRQGVRRAMLLMDTSLPS